MSHESEGPRESASPEEPERLEGPPPPKPFRWTERRAASLVSMITSGAVVVADLALLIVFIRVASNLPGGWGSYWYIPAGIAAVFMYALRRFLRQARQFREDD